MKKKLYINILIIIQISTFLLASIIFIIKYNCFNFSFYENFYKNYNLASELNIDYYYLLDNTKNLLNYLNNIDNLNTDWYTNKDILHMMDVKKLYIATLNVMNISLVIFALTTFVLIIILKRNLIKNILELFNKVAFAFIIFILLIASIVAINFNSFWIKFHQLLFSNDLWLLSPTESNLIKMVPEEFFFSLVSKIIIYIVLYFLLLMLTTFIINKKQIKFLK